MRDPRDQKSNPPSKGQPAAPEGHDSLKPTGALEKNLRLAAELEEGDDPDKREIGRLLREGSERIEAERQAAMSDKGEPPDGPFDGVKVPPHQAAGESPVTPRAPRDSAIEDTFASMRQEVFDLRQDVGNVLRELLVARGMEREEAGRRAIEALATPAEIAELDFATGAGRFKSELLELRRAMAIVMQNLLTKSGCPLDLAAQIAVEPLLPKTAKGSTPPESEGQELELQRFEQEVRWLCDQIALQRGPRPDRIDRIQQAPQEPEQRPGPAPERDRSWDRGHEW